MIEIIKLMGLIFFAFFFIWAAEKCELKKGDDDFIIKIEFLQYIFECIAFALIWFSARMYYTYIVI